MLDWALFWKADFKTETVDRKHSDDCRRRRHQRRGQAARLNLRRSFHMDGVVVS